MGIFRPRKICRTDRLTVCGSKSSKSIRSHQYKSYVARRALRQSLIHSRFPRLSFSPTCLDE